MQDTRWTRACAIPAAPSVVEGRLARRGSGQGACGSRVTHWPPRQSYTQQARPSGRGRAAQPPCADQQQDGDDQVAAAVSRAHLAFPLTTPVNLQAGRAAASARPAARPLRRGPAAVEGRPCFRSARTTPRPGRPAPWPPDGGIQIATKRRVEFENSVVTTSVPDNMKLFAGVVKRARSVQPAQVGPPGPGPFGRSRAGPGTCSLPARQQDPGQGLHRRGEQPERGARNEHDGHAAANDHRGSSSRRTAWPP